MRDDPIVAEVRAIRQLHAERFGYDLDQIFADFKRSEQERDSQRSPLVHPPSKAESTGARSMHRVRFANPARIAP